MKFKTICDKSPFQGFAVGVILISITADAADLPEIRTPTAPAFLAHAANVVNTRHLARGKI